MVNKVSNLLLKYKTDKHYGSIEPELGHYYGDSYDEIFGNFNKENRLNILEIGIQKGGSLLAWKEYFVNANIIGVDIVDSILPEYRCDDIKYIISDIKSSRVKDIIGDKKFDIIIDDGSHFLSDVLFVVSSYLNTLNSGGVLIIEDCQSPEKWVNEITKLVTNEFTLSTKDMRSVNGHYDDFLIVINRK